MKPGDQVYRWMTPSPLVVSRDATIAAASAMMRENAIRHLPVMDRSAVVGIVSAGDIAFVSRFVDPARTFVADAMSVEPYVVHPSTSLAEVADEMAKNKYGSAIVVEGGRVVGVFTAIDGLRALAEDRGRPSERRADRV